MSIPWLEEIVDSSGAPRMADFEAARLIYNRITGDAMSKYTFRRLPIPYRVIGRSRRYEVGVVVGCAKLRIKEAPVRKPSPRRKPIVATITP